MYPQVPFPRVPAMSYCSRLSGPKVPGEAAAEVVEDVAALLAADDGAAGPAERVHPGLDRDPIGVLDRGIVVDAQARAVVEEHAAATPEGVGLDGRTGNVIGAVHRIGGAVLRLRRRAGGIFLQMVDDAVVRVPGVGIVGLRCAGIAIVDVDLGVGERGQARDPDLELELAGHGVVGDESSRIQEDFSYST
jgi:hypothetical protein